MGGALRSSRLVAGCLTLLVAALAIGLASAPGDAAETDTCPACGAALEPGASFCSGCGRRLDAPVPTSAAADDPAVTVVQVVAVHDKELTSTYMAISQRSHLRIDAILGSAFAVAPGEFITDAGLVMGAREVTLRTGSRRSVAAQVVGVDPMIGVALLHADLPEIRPVPRRGPPPRIGEGLKAFGYPSAERTGGDPVSTPGVVSGLHRSGFGYHPIEDYAQTDATLADGFAGGPVVDTGGRLVGMSTAGVFGSFVALGPTGLGLSIPIDWIDHALDWIRAGTPPRPWIGIYTAAGDAERRAQYGLPDGVRRVITQVFPGSPAAAAGLRRGDGLMHIQGEGTDRLAPLHERLLAMKPGDKVTLEIVRSREPLKVDLTLAQRPDRPRLAGLDVLRFYGGFDTEPRGGNALVVTHVQPGSLAREAKVVPGDVLYSVLGKKDLDHVERRNARWRPVDTVAELEERLGTAYSELDFFVGLRFKGKDGMRRTLYLWDILTPTEAL